MDGIKWSMHYEADKSIALKCGAMASQRNTIVVVVLDKP